MDTLLTISFGNIYIYIHMWIFLTSLFSYLIYNMYCQIYYIIGLCKKKIYWLTSKKGLSRLTTYEKSRNDIIFMKNKLVYYCWFRGDLFWSYTIYETKKVRYFWHTYWCSMSHGRFYRTAVVYYWGKGNVYFRILDIQFEQVLIKQTKL